MIYMDGGMVVQLEYNPEMLSEVLEYRQELEEYEVYAHLSEVLQKQRREKLQSTRRQQVDSSEALGGGPACVRCAWS